ncbi:MAG TPA: hypothetical protein VF808_09990 [Ktedonobacterales bacterium]
MRKTTITRLWLAGLATLVGGLIIGGVSMGLMFAYGGHFTPALSGSGYDFTPTLNSYFWTTVAFMVVGFIVAAAGLVAELASWVGAVVNTYRLEDKAWFIALLVSGLLSLGFPIVGFGAMLAYIVAGPHELRREAPPLPGPVLERAPESAPLAHAR